MDKRVTFPESVEDAKKCVPGPNVVFKKKALPFSEYLRNTDNVGSLGCGPNKYPKYENGKYCCVDVMSTDQEKLDYINNLLENAMDVTGISSFKQQVRAIEWLLDFRDNLLKNYPNLKDNISVPQPFTSVEDWFNQNIRDLKNVSRFGSEDVDTEIMEGKTAPLEIKLYRKNILNKIAEDKAAEDKAAENIVDDVLDTDRIMIEPSNSIISLHTSEAPKNATVDNTKTKGCWGKFCETMGIKRNGGRKTKRLRKKYKKTRNIKKRQIKKRKTKRI
jgi:predicted transport protein